MENFQGGWGGAGVRLKHDISTNSADMNHLKYIYLATFPTGRPNLVYNGICLRRKKTQ